MTHAKLYSISAIARLMDLPESTLHYWKNRFDPFLPSVGQGRNKRFTAEAVDVFRTIGSLLESGFSVADAKAELARGADAASPASAPAVHAQAPAQPGPGEELAVRIGTAMAEALAVKLQGLLDMTPLQAGQPLPALGSTGPLQAELAQARAEIEELKKAGESTAAKLKVLEAELIRLRREGREMEKHLLGKIKSPR